MVAGLNIFLIIIADPIKNSYFGRMKKSLFFLFIGIFITNLVAEALQLQWLIYLSKPLLMTTLAAYFYTAVKDHFNTFEKYILYGLLFSIAGDTFLMFVEGGSQGELFFMLGLGSFLVTHVFYLLAFANYPSNERGWIRQHPLQTLPFLLLFAFTLYFLWDGIPSDLKIPVTVYSATIIAMAISACNLKTKMSPLPYQLLFVGAMFFVLSDSFIAMNKFKSAAVQLPYPRLLIMFFYVVGQWLIVEGAKFIRV